MAEHKFKLRIRKVKLLKRIYELKQEFVDRVLFEVCVHCNGYGLNEAQKCVLTVHRKLSLRVFDVRSVGRPVARG